MKKRSLSIRGHMTSISLEDEFWHELGRIAGGYLGGQPCRRDRQRARGLHRQSGCLCWRRSKVTAGAALRTLAGQFNGQ